MSDAFDVVQFARRDELRAWLEQNHDRSPGVWVRIANKHSIVASVSFEDLLEEGLCFGWSESSRKKDAPDSYLQRFTPRRTRGTTSPRNLELARRMVEEGRMTEAGLAALGLD